MFFFIYWIILLLSAGIFGLFGRQILGGLGYVRGFEMELLSVGVLGLGYCLVQLGYVALLRLLWPTKSPAPLAAESMSHLSVLALLPYQFGMAVPMPHPALEKYEALVFAGLFLALHFFLKLASMYASIRGMQSSRLPSLMWGGGAAACALGVLGLSGAWAHALERARPQAAGPVEFHDVGGVWRPAQVVPEGAEAVFDLDGSREITGLAFYIAEAPDEKPKPAPEAAGEAVLVSVSVKGATLADYSTTFPVKPGEWTSYALSPGQVPPEPRRCRISWRVGEGPKWAQYAPIRPVSPSTRTLLISGPEIHRQAEQKRDSIVLLVIEGLGTGRMSGFGYQRKTTRLLDAWLADTNAFPNVYTPVPDAAGACWTLVTGVNPLRHGVFPERTLNPDIQTMAEALSSKGYATAAFIEGNETGLPDLTYGSGFERGFSCFDAESRGTDETLQRAAGWIHTHQSADFFLFICLRELGNVQWNQRYAPGFVAGPSPTPVDVFDSALAYVDRAAGAFVRDVTQSYGSKTAIAVTSCYAYDFGPGKKQQPVIGLTEDSLRVPLLLYLPGEVPELRKEVTALEDICPTLMSRARVPLLHVTDGQDLMQHPLPRYVVSMYGQPLTLSLRFGPWRFAWNSGYQPGTGAVLPDQPIELLHIDRMRERGTPANDIAKNQGLVVKYRDYLVKYLQKNAGAGF